MQKIKTGDTVIVTTGQYKGKTAKIVKVNDKGVYLEGLNIKKRAKKGQGYIDVHHAINYSNVQFWDGNKASKVAISIGDDKKKVRVVKKTGELIK